MKTKLSHVAVAVRDLDEAERALSALVGARFTRHELPERGLAVSTAEVGGTTVELVAPTRAGTAVERFLEERGPGLHHVALTCEDLEETLNAACDAGFTPIGKPSDGLYGRVVFLKPAEPLGTLIELVEPK